MKPTLHLYTTEKICTMRFNADNIELLTEHFHLRHLVSDKEGVHYKITMILSQDKDLYKEYKAEGFQHDHQKKFKEWYESGGKRFGEHQRDLQRKLYSMQQKGYGRADLATTTGLAETTIENIMRGTSNSIGEDRAKEVMGML